MTALKREHLPWLYLLLLFLLAALQLGLWNGVGSRSELSHLQKNILRQQSENAILRARNEQIGIEVLSLKSGFDQIEAKAREELGLVRPNETLFLFVDEQTHAGQKPLPLPR